MYLRDTWASGVVGRHKSHSVWGLYDGGSTLPQTNMEPQKGPYQDRRPFETGDVGFQGEDMCLIQGCVRVHAVLALGLERLGHEVLARGMREYDHLSLKTPPQNQSFRYVVNYNIQRTSNITGRGVFILADGKYGTKRGIWGVGGDDLVCAVVLYRYPGFRFYLSPVSKECRNASYCRAVVTQTRR